MRYMFRICNRVGVSAHAIAGVTLIIMFFVTLAEVIMRFLWRSIPGTLELISLLGGIVVGLAVPYTSQMRGHINVDVLLSKLPETQRNVMEATTRLFVMVFFIFIGWSLISMGLEYHAAKEVSPTMKLPLYPVIFTLAGAFLVQAVQFLLDILKIYKGEKHE